MDITPRRGAVLAAQRIFDRADDVGDIADVEDMAEMIERALRDAHCRDTLKHFKGPESVREALAEETDTLTVERFWVFALAPDLRVLGQRTFDGGDAHCIVDLVQMMRFVIGVGGATGLLVAHNHPSGNANPSKQDHAITARLRDGAAALGLTLLDHVIVAPTGQVYSFATVNGR